MNISSGMKAAAALDIAGCPRSRQEIAERLSLALGRRITVAIVDAVVAQSHPHRMPADWVPAWVSITGSSRLLGLVCAGTGYCVADQLERDLAAYARAVLQREKADHEARELRARLLERV